MINVLLQFDIDSRIIINEMCLRRISSKKKINLLRIGCGTCEPIRKIDNIKIEFEQKGKTLRENKLIKSRLYFILTNISNKLFYYAFDFRVWRRETIQFT